MQRGRGCDFSAADFGRSCSVTDGAVFLNEHELIDDWKNPRFEKNNELHVAEPLLPPLSLVLALDDDDALLFGPPVYLKESAPPPSRLITEAL